jgi:hypothetical protein
MILLAFVVVAVITLVSLVILARDVVVYLGRRFRSMPPPPSDERDHEREETDA